MNTNTADNPYAPPVAHVADIAAAGDQLATRGARFLAALIDGVLQMALLWVISLLTPWKLFDPDPSFALLLTTTLLSLLLFLLMHGYLLVQRGQTIGKALLGLRIVRSDGSKVGAARILGLRYGIGWLIVSVPFAGLLYALVDALLIFRASRKCLHDNIADTIVVRT